MRATTVELGVIIKVVRSGDYDARLAIFTANGLQWLTAKGVLRPQAKLASATGLFTVAEFTHAGQTLTNANVLVAPYGLTKDLNRYYLACSLADALLRLEFVEQAPAALVAAVNALTDLATTDRSCYPIFIQFYAEILQILGYQFTVDADLAALGLQQARKLVKALVDAFLAHVDYQIQFCEKMYTT